MARFFVLLAMVEKNPWWRNCDGPFPQWDGPTGCKEDGGGCHRGQGLVGKMLVHRAVNNHDADGEFASTPTPIFQLIAIAVDI